MELVRIYREIYPQYQMTICYIVQHGSFSKLSSLGNGSISLKTKSEQMSIATDVLFCSINMFCTYAFQLIEI